MPEGPACLEAMSLAPFESSGFRRIKAVCRFDAFDVPGRRLPRNDPENTE
jgi:hypothetical protein